MSNNWQAVLAAGLHNWPELSDPGAVDISTFEDEGGEAAVKDPVKLFQTCAARGLFWSTPRFIDWKPDGGGDARTFHIEDLSDGQLAAYVAMKGDYGLKTWSLGGRGGKAYRHVDPSMIVLKQGPNFVAKKWSEYLDYIKRNAEICGILGTKLYRGFGFYRLVDGTGKYLEDRGTCRTWAADRVGEMADVLANAGVILGLECEPNLEFGTGWEIVELIENLKKAGVYFVMDAGNMAAWGYSVNEIVDMFLKGIPHMLWMHVKDYAWTGNVPSPAGGPLDEHNLNHFCPCDRGRGGHSDLFYLLSLVLPHLNAKAQALGLPGFGCELETHLWGGGQFGGLSRHEGIAIGHEALVGTLAHQNIRVRQRRYFDIRTARGLAPVTPT